jgi:two-component system, OmpR family, phosphate regulon response regulator OmpR
MPQHILLIDDDARLAHMVGEFLRQSGFSVSHELRGADGLQALHNLPALPNLIVLDLMLPDMDGLEVCRRIRALPSPANQIPILMLTAKGDPLDRVLGLEMGADDYLPKPFEPRELLARIRAILRRQGSIGVISDATAADTTAAESAGIAKTLTFGQLEVNPNSRQATLGGAICDLTSYQFDLLLAMAERAGRVLSREQIMSAVRGRELEAYDRSIDVHMGRIRAVIEKDAKNPQRILTVRGVGYVFAKQQS